VDFVNKASLCFKKNSASFDTHEGEMKNKNLTLFYCMTLKAITLYTLSVTKGQIEINAFKKPENV
jgi:hypothetical protein